MTFPPHSSQVLKATKGNTYFERSLDSLAFKSIDKFPQENKKRDAPCPALGEVSNGKNWASLSRLIKQAFSIQLILLCLGYYLFLAPAYRLLLWQHQTEEEKQTGTGI